MKQVTFFARKWKLTLQINKILVTNNQAISLEASSLGSITAHT
jgi:hypothetical protein